MQFQTRHPEELGFILPAFSFLDSTFRVIGQAAAHSFVVVADDGVAYYLCSMINDHTFVLLKLLTTSRYT